jgi:hypothetical protein
MGRSGKVQRERAGEGEPMTDTERADTERIRTILLASYEDDLNRLVSRGDIVRWYLSDGVLYVQPKVYPEHITLQMGFEVPPVNHAGEET